MTHMPNESSDFQQWEYERRREIVEEYFQEQYLAYPEQHRHAGMMAARTVDSFMKSTGTENFDDLGTIQDALTKVAFMFSGTEDPLTVTDLLPLISDRYEHADRDMVVTTSRVEQYVTYMPPYVEQVMKRAGEEWQSYSAKRALNEVQALLEASVETDFGDPGD